MLLLSASAFAGEVLQYSVPTLRGEAGLCYYVRLSFSQSINPAPNLYDIKMTPARRLLFCATIKNNDDGAFCESMLKCSGYMLLYISLIARELITQNDVTK
jgi:hypothetical protein